MEQPKPHDLAVLIIAVLAVIMCWWLLMTRPGLDVVQEAQTYCQMVHQGKWPDFHHVYAQQCKKDGSVNLDYVYGK